MLNIYVELTVRLIWFLEIGYNNYDIKSIDGYFDIDDLLNLDLFKGYCIEDFLYVAWCDEEKRFEYYENNNIFYIKFNY